MLAKLHRDIHGRVNVMHYLLAVVVFAGVYAVFMYYAPILHAYQIKSAAKDLALQGSTVESDDTRNKAWYDARMGELDLQYPLSYDLVYYRHDVDTVEVSYEYDHPIKHFFMSQPHVLHFEFRCKAYRGHCKEQ